MQQKKVKKFKVNFKKTFENLKAAADKLRITIPPKVEGGKPRYKEVIKQSVFDTAEKIYAIQIKDQKKLSKPGPIALRTKNLSLAKYCRNSERTIRRHLDILIEHGLIQAKARLGHGIQLLLNAALLAYDEIVMAAHPPANPKAPSPAPKPQDSQSLLLSFVDRFSVANALARS